MLINGKKMKFKIFLQIFIFIAIMIPTVVFGNETTYVTKDIIAIEDVQDSFDDSVSEKKTENEMSLLLAMEKGTGSDIGLSFYELLLRPNYYSAKTVTLQGDYELSNIAKIEAYSDNVDSASIQWNQGNNYGIISTKNPGLANITVKVYEFYTDEYYWVTTMNCMVVVSSGKPCFDDEVIYYAPDELGYCNELINVPSEFEIEWQSSDSRVAVVDNNGVVEPINNGVCYITAYFAQYYLSYKVIVKPLPNYVGKLKNPRVL